MKTQFAVILIFCLCIFGGVQIAHAAKDNGDFKCNPSGNQAELNVCALEAFQKQDEELNRLYKQQMAKLETPEIIERFKKAQQSWIKFRDASCLYEIGPREDSGSIWPLLNLDCMTAFTEERVKRLQTYVSCTDDQCPR